MASINGPGPSPVSPQPATTVPAGSTTQTPGVVLPPLYTNSFSGRGPAIQLGLSAPRNIGDLEAIFAEIATKLRETRTETESNTSVAETSSRRTQLAQAASFFSQLFKWGVEIDSNIANIKVQEAKIVVFDAELADLAVQKQTLESSKLGLETTIASLTTTIAASETQIGTNTREIQRLTGLYNQSKDAGERASLLSQIGALDRENTGLGQTIIRATTDRQKNQTKLEGVNAEIEGVDREIADVTEKREKAVKSKKASEDRIGVLTTASVNLVLTLIPFAISALLGGSSQSARQSGQTRETGDNFEQTLKETIESISDLGEIQLDLNFTSQGAADGASSGTAAALGFATLAASVVSSLQDALRAPSPQSAQGFGQDPNARVRLAI